MPNRFAALPAVHRLLAIEALEDARNTHGHRTVRDAARETLAAARARIAAGAPAPALAELAGEVEARLARATAPAYPEVVNATGVVIHTNLGRAPRLAPALPAYLALELELDGGGRGERLAPVASRLTRYFRAEAASVVTNNAAALVLLLAAHAAGREVIVSRGELIEIGGSFRLPEIMAASGARLVEVGCTNRTHLEDYAAAIGPDTAGILVVHRSNFSLDGFVAQPELVDLVRLGRDHGLPVWVDQGSGCHLDLARYGLRREATVRELLAGGAAAVLLSGDKLLGGPQAGIVVGDRPAIAPLARHPLRRALRPDKSALLALAATLDAYLAERPEEVPLYRLLGVPETDLRRRARRIAAQLRRAGFGAQAVATRAVLGGGTTPDQTLSSWAVTLPATEETAARLRRGRPAVVGRVENGRVVLDLRAVFPAQDRGLAGAAIAAARG
ncbi:MAG TPA: L-seryl-tRNA(Sec) selenium transferase [Thermoanaerobaculaceae bacterium]|nr:L-seryl-tRNA(Sec) selenium transferase [Thermoanaerobaculaceae bacterium]